MIVTPLLSSTPGFITSTMIRGVGNGVIFSQRATIASDAVGADCVSDAIGLMLLAFAVGMITANLMGGMIQQSSLCVHSYIITTLYVIFITNNRFRYNCFGTS